MTLKSILQHRFSKDVFWNIGSLVVMAFSGILLNVLIARQAGAEALGLFNQIFAFYSLFSLVTVGGIHYSILQSIAGNLGDPNANKTSFASAFIATAVLTLIVSPIPLLFREEFADWLGSPDVAFGLMIVTPGLVGFSLNKVLLNVLNGLSAMKSYAVFQSIRYFMILAGAAIILNFGLEPKWIAGCLTFSEAILFVSLFGYVHFKAIRFSPAYFNLQKAIRHLSFGWRSFLTGSLSEINARVNALALGYYTSDYIVGVFSFAAILAEGFYQIPTVLRRNIDPILGESFARNDKERIERASRKIKKIFLPAMLGLAVASILAYPFALKLLVGSSEFDRGAIVFAILLGGIAINSGSRPFLGIILQGGRPGLNSLIILVLIFVNLAGNLLLIPKFGMHGTATATAVTHTLEALAIVWFSRKLFGIKL